MNSFRVLLLTLSIFGASTGQSQVLSQTVAPTDQHAVVPTVINFNGTIRGADGKPFVGLISVTFSLFAEQEGGAPMWSETQSLQTDNDGRYITFLGVSSKEGLGAALFATGSPRWLRVQPEIPGQEEPSRIMLVSVPYALKAADAETLGGLPASAFLQNSPSVPAGLHDSTGTKPATASPITGAGTANVIPMWTSATTIGNSILFQKGSFLGIGTNAPVATLDALGTGTVIRGVSSGSAGIAIAGYATSTTGNTVGIRGSNSSPSGLAMYGVNSALGGTAIEAVASATGTTPSTALVAISSSGKGIGMNGNGGMFGVYGTAGSDIAGAAGIYGQATGASLGVYGVQGVSSSYTGTGVYGIATAGTGNTHGVMGVTDSSTGTGVVGAATVSSGLSLGVYGTTPSGTDGSCGVAGTASGTSGQVVGVYGVSYSSKGYGVIGQDVAGGIGVEGNSPGIAGQFVTDGGLVLQGLSGTSYREVLSVDASGNGYFAGNLTVTGKLSKGSGSFKIDHPLDPENKYLSHSFVESPDMMNIYNGNVTTNRRGIAVVSLPNYFEALNGDFRYQLTVVGQMAQAIIAAKVQNNQFVIKTNKPLVEVSWQVTGIRKDAFANANRIHVEEEKDSAERGYYLHPAAFNQPASRGIPETGAARSVAKLPTPLQ